MMIQLSCKLAKIHMYYKRSSASSMYNLKP